MFQIPPIFSTLAIVQSGVNVIKLMQFTYTYMAPHLLRK